MDSKCGPAFSNPPLYGDHFLQRLGEETRERVMRCHNVSEETATKRDDRFMKRRLWCIRQEFPNVDASSLEEYFCNMSKKSFHSGQPDVEKYKKAGLCLFEAHDKHGEQAPELKAAQKKCLQEAFPDAADPRIAFVDLMEKIADTQRHVFHAHAEVLHCLRDFFLPHEEQMEVETFEAICRQRLLPDVEPDRLESVFYGGDHNATAMLDERLALCVFLESRTGKWARAEMKIFYDCLEDVLKQVPDSSRISHRMGVDIKQEVMDEALTCESKGGTVIVSDGIRRPDHLTCVLGLVKDRPYDHQLNTTLVYDSPEPQEKMALCLSHSRASSQEYLEYRSYKEKKDERMKSVAECLGGKAAEEEATLTAFIRRSL
ncbi:uncharacterized protein LOC135365937 [Ornithodoros turicata]|uniref:uncharacterized protein LOC135365937 n=1 Tax=Ornithodoros turicata TaxID=34597 RepID=UPI0031394C6E